MYRLKKTAIYTFDSKISSGTYQNIVNCFK